MARRAARNGAALGGNDAELNDLVAALESEVEERAAATEQHDKKPAAKQFALRMLAGCIVLRVRSIAADQYTIKGRFARIPRVSPMISPKMRNQNPVQIRACGAKPRLCARRAAWQDGAVDSCGPLRDQMQVFACSSRISR